MTTGEPIVVKTELPGWAKFLIGAFVAGLVAAILFIVVGSVSLGALLKDARDAGHIGQIAQDRFHMSTLPDGFRYILGYEFAGLDVVQISYEKSKTEFILLKVQNAKNLTNDTIEPTLPNDPTQPAPLENVKTKGEVMVGGSKLQYIIGTVNLGAQLAQLRGAMLMENGKYLIRLTGTTAEGAYDLEATKKLLASIK